jgi:hypothetical protein
VPALALLLLLAAEPTAPATPAAPPVAATNELAPPVFASAGYTKPAEAKKNCVANAVRIPKWMAGINGAVVSKFSVDAEGAVGNFEVLTEAPREVRLAIEQAVQSCQFTPGRTPEGKAVAVWMILPMRFKSDPAPARLPLRSEPTLIDPNCVEMTLGAQGSPVTAQVSFVVSEEGKPQRFDFGPALSRDPRETAIVEAIKGCAWKPALDADGRPVPAPAELRVRSR